MARTSTGSVRSASTSATVRLGYSAARTSIGARLGRGSCSGEADMAREGMHQFTEGTAQRPRERDRVGERP